jgi:hypothetical protein
MKQQKQQERLRAFVMVALPLFFLALGWYAVFAQAYRMEASAIRTFQEAELEVVQNAARASSVYITNEIERRGTEAIPDIEQEVLDNFVDPIHIGTLGDAWIYSPEYAIFDQSEDFPREYIGKSMAEIFTIQQANGAQHYEAMSAAVMNGEEGVGWYMWEPDKAAESTPWWEFATQDTGWEIAAWTPVVVFPDTDQELIWVIGMSAMLPEILQSTGVYAQTQEAIITMSIVTLVVFGMLYFLNRAEVQVQELRQQVKELHIQVDEAKRAREVNAIMETDYFRDLSARATSLREQRKARANHVSK